ncbi:WD40 repeat domain-containing protein [Neotabrizicola sp. VNH66]|uniref:WD40 repeat domain-containing protein n=1 Tax=Neotabrizicola sp. VNH66 TaxID=3400918 RepID=UPI003C0182E8
MNQTLASPPAPAGLTGTALFDLLARSWTLEAPVASVTLDTAGKAAGFALADGRLALVPLDDPDSPMQRIRLELDSGRSTIRQREKPVAPPVYTENLGGTAAMVAASGKIGFLAAAADGRVWRVTPRGQVIPLSREARPLSALATDGRGLVALAQEGKVDLLEEEGMTRRVGLLTAGAATALAFAPDGQSLAVRLAEGVLLWPPGQEAVLLPFPGSGPVAFSAGGGWLAASDGDQGLWLYRRADGSFGQIGNFRAPPLSMTFGAGDATLFAGGAFRLAGWSLDTPPLDGGQSGALRSGRSGLVLVERVAAHPDRDLVAFGTAEGAVALVRPGLPDEMLLCPGDGAAITALHWSACGLHLAIGTAAGGAALVTLPPRLFK